jgi:predicted TPR repeat methyltransferase
LTGVDLSPRLLYKARARGIYDRLVAGDLIEFLDAQNQAYDLAVAADVLNYLGDLSPAFAGGGKALRSGGLFCFSVEAAEEGDFTLRATSRYAHSENYLRRLAERHRFAVESIEPQALRRDRGTDVVGYLAVLRVP